uniref:Uncharacterized protein n=1 Tax=Panagrolaimus sp. ES5 TaxID=591445 RepID=A0AC34FU32_9BILA
MSLQLPLNHVKNEEIIYGKNGDDISENGKVETKKNHQANYAYRFESNDETKNERIKRRIHCVIVDGKMTCTGSD